MLKMLPSYINGKIKSYGKNLIFNLLKNNPKNEDWIVTHLYNLPSTVTAIGKEKYIFMNWSIYYIIAKCKSG